MPHYLNTRDMDIGERAHRHFADGLHDRVVEDALDAAYAAAPIDDGELRAGLHAIAHGSLRSTIVGEAEHTEYVLKGTGIYGPSGQPIRSENGPMVFVDSVTNELVFTYEIKGMRPQDFAADAVEEVDRSIRNLARDQATVTRTRFSGGG